jgi:exodeoxyribonuclease V alpha subunit
MELHLEEIYGYIESILFTESERGFTIAKLKEPRKKELTTIVGIMPSVQPGESIRCRGMWKHHHQHGQQFEVKSFELQAPSDLIGIQKYLESGMIKGIGPVYAERIVKKFGLDTLQIIEESPEKLLEVSGLGEKRLEKIKSCWLEQKSIRQVMIFLRGHGVSPAFAQKIFKTYGDKSIEKVQTNPFSLAKEIFGIGFKVADRIAEALGIAKESASRIDAAIEHVLWELSNEGHTCFPKHELVITVQELLGIESGLIEGRVAYLIENNILVFEEDMVWIKPIYLWELGIAREVMRLKQEPCALRQVAVEKAIDWVQNLLTLTLAEEQKEGVAQGVSNKVLLLTGGPGTGKSTITKAILQITEKLSTNILLAAPTGRAAKRMTEITEKTASTIHSLLEMDFTTGKFKRNKDNPLSCDLIIIDEASMIDTQLMYNLLRAIPSSARVIFIGDIDQLPSVGPGSVLKDLIRSQVLPVVELKQIFRQAAGSRIITNAHLVNQGVFPDIHYQPKSDFLFFEEETPEGVLNKIVKLVQSQLSKSYRFHRFDDIQVLSPMKKGIIGTENLNTVLQDVLNPFQNRFSCMGRSFQVGDKVMQIRNNYQKNVFNGDIGKIVEIDMTEQIIKVVFDDKWISYEYSEIDELILAYAVSIHKYQGSECPCVVIPIHTSHFKLLYRNLLYTGITRGKKMVVLVGSKKALAMAVKNEESRKRHTGLEKRLKEWFSSLHTTL